MNDNKLGGIDAALATPPTLRDMIANDAYAATFQSLAQYRAALLALAITHAGNTR